MSDELEVWAELREEKRQRHAAAHAEGVKEIEELRAAGYGIHECSQWHYQIGTMNLWPSSRRFYDSATGKKGNYGRELVKFIQKRFKPENRQ